MAFFITAIERISHFQMQGSNARQNIMLDLFDKINESVAFIRKQWTETAKVGIVLGTGLGPLVEKIDVQASIDYGDIPNFPKSTALSHKGRLVCGTLNGLPVVAMEGRLHMYEGYPLKEITLPILSLIHI